MLFSNHVIILLFKGSKTNIETNKKSEVGFQQYSALVNPRTNSIAKTKPSAGPAGPRGRMLPAVPSPSLSPFKPIQSPIHQGGTNNMISASRSSPSTYHSNDVKTSQAILRQNQASGDTYLNEGNHNYINVPSELNHQPEYANVPVASGSSRPNSTTSFAEIQQAKQKQQQLEQQRRRESTGSGRFLSENTTSSRLVSNAMSEMMQNNLSNNVSSQARHRSSSQASLTSSSTTGIYKHGVYFPIFTHSILSHDVLLQQKMVLM